MSAKLGTGVEDVLKAIVNRLPPPPVNRDAPFRALLFDSWYDRYRGAVILVYVTDGTVQVGDEIVTMHSGKNYEVKSIGLLRPHEEPTDKLYVLFITFYLNHIQNITEYFYENSSKYAYRLCTHYYFTVAISNFCLLDIYYLNILHCPCIVSICINIQLNMLIGYVHLIFSKFKFFLCV